MRIAELRRRSGVSLGALFGAAGMNAGDDRDVVTSVELELKYSGYMARERVAAERLQSLGEVAIPHDSVFTEMRSLSTEARHKLEARRPVTLAQAATIPGVSPSDLQNLVLELARARRERIPIESTAP